jgi:hypothetical protein
MKAEQEMLEALRRAENALRWAARRCVGRVRKDVVGGFLHEANVVRDAIERAEHAAKATGEHS